VELEQEEYLTEPEIVERAFELDLRELRCFWMTLNGKNNQEIADELGLSVPTVKKILGTVYIQFDLWKISQDPTRKRELNYYCFVILRPVLERNLSRIYPRVSTNPLKNYDDLRNPFLTTTPLHIPLRPTNYHQSYRPTPTMPSTLCSLV
jgi:hypothetical protein